MKYMELRKLDSGNGIGCRVSLFVSGCDVHCPDCFNKEAWDFNAGKEFTKETVNEILDTLGSEHIAGLSILGGDPISNVIKQGKEGNHILIDLVQSVKYYYPEKSIFVWTGYKFEDIINDYWVNIFLDSVDMLRDGPFIEEQKNLNQYLQGSSNQRYIDVQHYMKTKEIKSYSF